MDKSPKTKKVELRAKNVDWICRELFNEACSQTGENRGAVLSSLLREFAKKRLGEVLVDDLEREAREGRWPIAPK